MKKIVNIITIILILMTLSAGILVLTKATNNFKTKDTKVMKFNLDEWGENVKDFFTRKTKKVYRMSSNSTYEFLHGEENNGVLGRYPLYYYTEINKFLNLGKIYVASLDIEIANTMHHYNYYSKNKIISLKSYNNGTLYKDQNNVWYTAFKKSFFNEADNSIVINIILVEIHRDFVKIDNNDDLYLVLNNFEEIINDNTVALFKEKFEIEVVEVKQ